VASDRRSAAALWPLLPNRPDTLPRQLDGRLAGTIRHPAALVGAASAARAPPATASRPRGC